MTRHKDQVTTGLHVACYTVADETARNTLETSLVAADRGHIILQLDDGSLWRCTAAATLDKIIPTTDIVCYDDAVVCYDDEVVTV